MESRSTSTAPFGSWFRKSASSRAVLFDLGEERELAGGGEVARFDGVGGELSHLFEGELEVLMDEHVLVEQGGAEHGGIVGVEGDHEAAVEVEVDRVGIDGGAATGAEVGGDVELERDLALGEEVDELGVKLRGERVADAFGADVDGRPDGLGTDRFPGVRGEVQAGGRRFGVELAEGIGGAARFVSTDADAGDGRVVAMELGGLAEGTRGFLHPEMADGIDEPENGGAEVGLRAGAAAFDGGEDLVHIEAAEVIEDAEGDIDLGVADALEGEIANHVEGDELVVGGGVQTLGDALEAHEEAGEVGVMVELACGLGCERHGVVAMAELDEGLWRDGAFEMQMELGLGEIAEPGAWVDGGLAGGGRALARHGSSVASERARGARGERPGIADSGRVLGQRGSGMRCDPQRSWARSLIGLVLLGGVVAAGVEPAGMPAQSKRPEAPTRVPPAWGARLPDGANAPADTDGDFVLGPTHTAAPEMTVHAGVPQGRVIAFAMRSEESALYPGIARKAGTFGVVDAKDPATLIVRTSHPAPYTRRVEVYVPQQYVAGTAAPFLVGADGPDRGVFTALDNLIAAKQVPVMIAISIGNGGGDAQGSERGLEYDTMSGRYAEFVEKEVLPLVETQAQREAD